MTSSLEFRAKTKCGAIWIIFNDRFAYNAVIPEQVTTILTGLLTI